MSTLVNTYPVFSPSQVLTNSHLNSIRDFLDGNLRFDRTALNGVGIICGLGASLDTSNPLDYRITVGEGLGITQEGYVIKHSTTVYNKAASYINPTAYAPWASATGNDILELIPVSGSAGDALQEIDLEDRAVVAFIEVSDSEQESCLAVENTFGGIRRDLILRILLVKKEVLLVPLDNKQLLSVTDPAYTIKLFSFNKGVSDALPGQYIWDIDAYGDIQNAYTNMISDAQLKLGMGILTVFNAYRSYLGLQFNQLAYKVSGVDVGLSQFTVQGFNLSPFITIGAEIQITDSLENNGTYTVSGISFTGDTVITVSEAIPDAGVDGNVLVAIDFEDFIANGLTNKNLVSGNEAVIQYVFSYLSDLLRTYNELGEVAYAVKQYCVPELNQYPRHLMIADAAFKGKDYDAYRNYFIESSNTSGKDVLILKAQMVFEKLITMIRSFNVIQNPLLPVILTPSLREKAPLNASALPYYYDVSSNGSQFAGLIALWNASADIKGKGTDVQSYHLNIGNSITKPTGVTIPDYVANPYHYDTLSYDFVRIEGHIQKNISAVLPQLEMLASTQNIRFNVASVELNNIVTPPVPPDNFDFSNFRHFAYKYPGMTHQGGVAVGDTLVLVHDNTGTIVADFSIPLDVIQ